MGGRYLLTGVQMGILMSITDEKTKMEILQEIMDNQFIGNIGDNDLIESFKELLGVEV